jgi:hypothetical protein
MTELTVRQRTQRSRERREKSFLWFSPRPLLLCVLCVITAVATACRPQTQPTPDTQADSLAIRRDVEYLASPALAGRLTGTPGNDSAAAYIARRYAALGLEPLTPQYLQRFVARPLVHLGVSPQLPTQNVLAVARGTDPVLRNQYVVVGAHFDHLGLSTEFALDPNDKTSARVGADDNASGRPPRVWGRTTTRPAPPRCSSSRGW